MWCLIFLAEGYNMNLLVTSGGWLLFNLQETLTLADYRDKLTIKSIKDTSTILQQLLCELRYGLWSNDWFPSETQLCLKHSEALLETTDRHPDHWSVKKPDTRPQAFPLGHEEDCAWAFCVAVVCALPESYSSAHPFTLAWTVDLPFSEEKNPSLDWHCKRLFCVFHSLL